MSQRGSLQPDVERLIRDLRAEVRALSLRTQALEARIALLEKFEVINPPASPRPVPATSSAVQAPPATPIRTSAASPSSGVPTPSPSVGLAEDSVDPSDTAGRAGLAREIGGFLRRSLAGGCRGSSGR